MTVGDFDVAIDALSCYLDYLKRAGLDKKNPRLYAGVSETMRRTEDMRNALRKADNGEPVTLIKG